MTVFEGALDATFAAFGIDAVYTPAGGDPVGVRVIARRPDTIIGFGELRITPETATRQGVVLRPEDVRDDEIREALINEANRLYGRRSGGVR
jgi:hypothetical protein